MKWHKLGQVFVPEGDLWWARRRAYLPTPEVRNETIRVYFASYDDDWVGRIGFIDLDARNPKRILWQTTEPVFENGGLGAFDAHGVTPSCVLNCPDGKRLYYYGWQRVEGTHPLYFEGLAFWNEDTFRFERWASVPILDRREGEAFGRAGCSILHDGDRFRMWYVASIGWIDLGDNPLFKRGIYSRYDLRHLESADGLSWPGLPVIVAEPSGGAEFGLGRPWVIREDDGSHKLWYSVRSRTEPYRIGYAESKDGLSWTRRDAETGIGRSESGWDSEMICFAAVIDAGSERYMFYNGNQHGETGFGVAILEDDWRSA